MIASSNKSQAEQTNVYRRIRQRRHFALHCVSYTASKSRFERWVEGSSYLYQQLSDSFLGEILTLVFGMAYGITEVLYARLKVPDVGLSDGQNAMGFGQLVPLLLMVLPILAAGEVYFGKNE